MQLLLLIWMVMRSAATTEQVPLSPILPSSLFRHLQSSSSHTNTTSSNGSTALQKMLLENYDRYSYPFEHLWAWNNNTGLPIDVSINFHRVFSLDVTASTADVIVWVRQVWNDPRLVWDPNSYNNITTVQLWVNNGIGAGETSQIWTPDLHLWNAAEPLSSSLSDAHALVSNDGTVFWARPGHLVAACRFGGLDLFPFDRLSCTFEIGSWAHSGKYLRPEPFEGGFTLGGSQTAGQAFAEFTLESVRCSQYVYPPFIEAPDEDWPVLLYDVTFVRAWEPYGRGFILLQVLLNFIGFSTFWLSPQTNERMGLSITSLLASVASELAETQNIPAFGELSWVARFTLVSMLFTAFALFENIVVIYLHYHSESSLVPRYADYWKSLLKALNKFKPTSNQDVPRNSISNDVGEVNSSGESRDRPILTTSWKSSDALHLQRFSVRQGIRTILGRDADYFRNAEEMENNLKWQQKAFLIDEVSRIAFPAVYGVFLVVMFSRTRTS